VPPNPPAQGAVAPMDQSGAAHPRRGRATPWGGPAPRPVGDMSGRRRPAAAPLPGAGPPGLSAAGACRGPWGRRDGRSLDHPDRV